MYQLNNEKMFYDFADDLAILINYISGQYYGMNPLGSWVFNQLMNGADKAAVVAALEEVENCPADIGAQVDAFLAKVLEREILVPGETKTVTITAPTAAALTDGWVLTVDDFAEVQDLLMADPIHEVDPSMGWPARKTEA